MFQQEFNESNVNVTISFNGQPKLKASTVVSVGWRSNGNIQLSRHIPDPL